MNVLTDYYKFERVAEKAKLRLDCTASTESYPELEEKRAIKATRATEQRDATNVGDLVIYFGDVPDSFGYNIHRKADKSITIKGKNLSSVYMPDPKSDFGYGDFRATNDALLFVFHNCNVINGRLQAGAVIEVFISRGESKNRVPLFNLLLDGELDEEMEVLRKKAVTKSVTTYNT